MNHIELGKSGEQAAVDFLEAKGYRILARNWRWGRQEIDIIAVYGDVIAIVEVKTRISNRYSEPEESVTVNKQRILVRAANAYVNFRRLQGEVRFDIISILNHPNGLTIKHIVDAFTATL